MQNIIYALIAAVAVAAVAASWTIWWKGQKLEEIRAIAAIISAAAAVTIPLVLYQAAASGRSNDGEVARKSQTLLVMNDLDQRIDSIVSQKRALDDHYGVRDDQKYSFEYIESHREVRTQVIRLLNAYEFMCIGVNKALLSRDIVLAVRRDALLLTWDQYAEYIEKNRTADVAQQDSWTDCSRFIRELKDTKIAPSPS